MMGRCDPAEGTSPMDDHYADRQWNELYPVIDYLQRRATGDPTRWWMDDLRDRHAPPGGFAHALVIGCGNGWVERDLSDRGVARRFDAFDASGAYLEEAQRQRGDRPIRYFAADFGSLTLDRRYDLIVNVAALHHARFLYRATRTLSEALTDDGLFVHWEYVGPSRNQYPGPQVAAMEEARRSLPLPFRTPHPLRPDLHDTVELDPTEAVHSSEIRRAVHDHLDVLEWHDLGGGVAYQLLWNHIEPFREKTTEAGDALAALLRSDERLSGTPSVPNLFAYVIARRPRGRPPLGARYRLLVFEPVREAVAARTGGYYPRELLRLFVARHAPLVRVVRRLRR